jgi:hypothetical protein
MEFTLHKNHTVSAVTMVPMKDETLSYPASSDGPYRFTAYDVEGQQVYKIDTVFSFSSSIGSMDSMPVTVRLPYSNTVTRIELLHDGEIIHTFEPAATLCPPPSDRDIYQRYCDAVNPGILSTLVSSPVKAVGIILGLLLLAGGAVYGYQRYQDRQHPAPQRGRRGRRDRQIQNNQDRRRR